MTDNQLLELIEEVKRTMISVATGGERIDSANARFRELRDKVSTELVNRGLPNPLVYSDLWDWYGKWSSGDLPTYQSRRVFVNELVNPLVETLSRISSGTRGVSEPTGWHRVDRNIDGVRTRLATAQNVEHFQTVGLLCRETLISLAQAVYDPEIHRTVDGIVPSHADARRMLEAFIASELQGSASEEVRRHAKAALSLAAALQHRRTATFRDAAMCEEATTTVVSICAITSGRRDP